MRVIVMAAIVAVAARCAGAASERRLGKLQEVFAWKQITYNIDGKQVLQDQAEPVEVAVPTRNTKEDYHHHHSRGSYHNHHKWRPSSSKTKTTGNTLSTSTTAKPVDEAQQFFIQYNNLPMGVERVGNRVFVTVPRRRYGIPSTLNYLDLTEDIATRSPGLRPYPDLATARTLTSVYRTRADHCGRLWMVDNGMLELPNNHQQIQQSAIVVFNLTTDKQLFRYPLKNTDIIASDTPTGLASITLDFVDMNDCSNVYAYIPDLYTYGLIVYSLKDNDSWRLNHNFFHFNPVMGNIRVSGQYFQWSDGIFSMTLTETRRDGCRTAFFHPMVSTHEFSVSTCVLRNRNASQDTEYWKQFSIVGDRGANSQCTLHGYHAGTGAILFGDISRNALSCWNTRNSLEPANMAILYQDDDRLGYPSDLHVTGDEVWFMANNLPTWAYSHLDTDQYNFYVYKADIKELISGTVCDSPILKAGN